MVRTIPISSPESLEHPELTPYRGLRDLGSSSQGRRFIGEGPAVVRRLLRSELTLHSFLLTPSWRAELDDELQRRSEPIDLFVASEDVLRSLVGFRLFNGVLALASAPAVITVPDLLKRVNAPGLFVALDGLNQAENVGGLIRSAAALGVSGVIVGETCASPWLRRSVRASMGTIMDLPIAETASLEQGLGALRDAGVHLVLADGAGTLTPWEIDWRSPICVVLGSEGHGARPGVRQLCQSTVRIPMRTGIDSLNVAAAGAALFHEALRQRMKA